MIFFIARSFFLLTGNDDSFVSDGGCKHHTHLEHTCARANVFLRVAQGLTRFKCLDCSIFSARHFQKNFRTARMHAMFRTLLDPPFTTLSQSTSTSSSPLSPSNWTPTASPLCGRFAEQSPLTVTFVLWCVKELNQLRKKQCNSLGKHTFIKHTLFNTETHPQAKLNVSRLHVWEWLCMFTVTVGDVHLIFWF